MPAPAEPAGKKYKIELIAGGIVKDKNGKVLDDSSHVAAQEKLQALGLPNLLDAAQGKDDS